MEGFIFVSQSAQLSHYAALLLPTLQNIYIQWVCILIYTHTKMLGLYI